jgi:hypothetical protein
LVTYSVAVILPAFKAATASDAVKFNCSVELSGGVAPESPPQAVKPAPTPPSMAAADTAPVFLKKLRRDVFIVIDASFLVVTPPLAFNRC